MLFKVRELVSSCDTPILQNIADEFQDLKDEQINKLTSSVKHDNHHRSTGDLSPLKNSIDSEDVEEHWRWSGSSFVKSPTIEPWVRREYSYLTMQKKLFMRVTDLNIN